MMNEYASAPVCDRPMNLAMELDEMRSSMRETEEILRAMSHHVFGRDVPTGQEKPNVDCLYDAVVSLKELAARNKQCALDIFNAFGD